MDWVKTFQKSILGFVTGLAGVVVFGIIQAISNYKPIVCSDEITTNCTPQIISTLYYSIVPIVTGVLVGLGNWLKNREKEKNDGGITN